MDKLRDITPEEKELIKELKKIEEKKEKRHNQIIDSFLWGAAKYGNYEGVLKRRKKKKKKLSNDCKKCYYAVLCYERGRGVACTQFKKTD